MFDSIRFGSSCIVGTAYARASACTIIRSCIRQVSIQSILKRWKALEVVKVNWHEKRENKIQNSKEIERLEGTKHQNNTMPPDQNRYRDGFDY